MIIINMVIGLLMGWLAILLHELGHFIAGKSAGWKFYTLVAGPFGIKKENDKLSLFLERDPAFWGGYVRMFPKAADEDWAKGYLRTLMGGPAASILMAAIFITMYFFTRNFHIGFFGIFNILIGMATLIWGDGKIIRILKAGGQKAEEEIALLKAAKHDFEVSHERT